MRTTMQRAVALTAILMALTPAAFATAPQTTDLTETFRGAGAAIDRLQVVEISGIVIIRGRAADKAQAEAVGLYAQNLGYSRVANLIQIATHGSPARPNASCRSIVPSMAATSRSPPIKAWCTSPAA